MNNNCPICGFVTETYDFSDSKKCFIECVLCGSYFITEFAIHDLQRSYNLSSKEIANLIGFIRDNQGIIITSERIKRVNSISTLTVEEKASRILLQLSKIFPNPGQEFLDFYEIMEYGIRNKGSYYKNTFNKSNKELLDYLSVYAVSRSLNMEEFNFLFYDYLNKELRFILGQIKITPAGWAYIDSLKQRNKESKTAFIAMRFTDELLEFCDQYFDAGIRQAGYEPLRIDKHEHNNLIDDEIIAGIRKSKFVIADFTDNSYGVYYEAGYARGFNIPVIYLCNEEFFNDEKTKPHFDVNHYSMILWNYGDEGGKDLIKKLKNRIEATIGRGLLS